jgi:hypothetical protein
MKIKEPTKPLLSDSKIGLRISFIRRSAGYLAVILIVALILLLVLLSPLLLRQLGRISGVDWARLSNIGQTYGAASAVLSAIALIGISLSLLVQARQARDERIRLVFERHVQLLSMVLERPDLYGPVMGFSAPAGIEARQYLFATMLMNYARMGYITGIIPEEDLRAETLREVFQGEPMRIW